MPRRPAAPRPPPRPSLRPLSGTEIERKLATIEPKWKAPRPSLCPPDIRALLEKLRASAPEEREAAARALGEARAAEAAEALRPLLADVSKPVRSAAALALARLGDRAILAEMSKALSDPKPRAVAGAALALGLSGDRSVVGPLIESFKTHDPVVGAAVATALGMLGDARALASLVQALKAGFVLPEVCQALGRIADGSAAPALVRALRHPDPKARAEAARALGRLKAALSPDAAGKAFAPLRKLLDDPNARVRLSAALSLYELGDRGAGTRLVEVLQGS